MSTRGSVAIGSPKSWRGVYNHWDSYPTGLGKEVWQHLQKLLQNGKTLNDFASDLLAYDDWRAYLNRGICEYCGRRASQPHSISGVIALRHDEFATQAEMRAYYTSLRAWRGREREIEAAIAEEWRVRESVARTGYPDPELKHHAHDTRPPKDQQITSDNPDPLFIEWVYVIDPKAGTFHVLGHNGQTRRTVPLPPGPWRRKEPGGGWNYGHCIYWHELVASLPLTGPEPDWEALETLKSHEL